MTNSVEILVGDYRSGIKYGPARMHGLFLGTWDAKKVMSCSDDGG